MDELRLYSDFELKVTYDSEKGIWVATSVKGSVFKIKDTSLMNLLTNVESFYRGSRVSSTILNRKIYLKEILRSDQVIEIEGKGYFCIYRVKGDLDIYRLFYLTPDRQLIQADFISQSEMRQLILLIKNIESILSYASGFGGRKYVLSIKSGMNSSKITLWSGSSDQAIIKVIDEIRLIEERLSSPPTRPRL